MTNREAMKILIEFAAEWGSGCGTGVRETLKEEDINKIRSAIQKVWPKVYNYPFSKEDLFNLGL